MPPLDLLFSTFLTLCLSYIANAASDPLNNCKIYTSHTISQSYRIPAITISSSNTLQASTSQQWVVINALSSVPEPDPSSTPSSFGTYSGDSQTALTRGIFLDTSNTFPPISNSSDFDSLPAAGCAFALNLQYDDFDYQTYTPGSNGSCTSHLTSPCLNAMKETLQEKAIQLANLTATEGLESTCGRLAGSLRDTNLPDSCKAENSGSSGGGSDYYYDTNSNPSFNISTTCECPSILHSLGSLPNHD